ncbi:hypothetical protein [Streptomyces sp. NPDC093600]|uniref:hypothetical protein n=1 Tax=Streptomyces sp. NPDC093600 TaxID=3366047 RepID=UPI0038196CAF
MKPTYRGKDRLHAPSHQQSGGLMIVRRYFDADDELAQYLRKQLNTPLDWPKDAELNTERVAEIAAAAACDASYNQAANGHLADLFALLPLPGTPEGSDFWDELREAGGLATLYVDPANAGGPFFSRLVNGNEGGIASRVLSFLGELDDQQRDAVADVIGGAVGDIEIGSASRYLGKLWMRDAEVSAWHVLVSQHRSRATEDDRKRFFEAWGNA